MSFPSLKDQQPPLVVTNHQHVGYCILCIQSEAYRIILMHISHGDCSQTGKVCFTSVSVGPQKKKNAKENTPDSHGTTTVFIFKLLYIF